MKKAVLVSVAILFLVGSFATVAVAGTEPSPFKDQADAISMHVKVLGKTVDDKLGSPPDDIMPGEVKRFVVDLHSVAADIMGLHGFASGIIANPGSEVMGVEPSPFRLVKRQLNKILDSIDMFLGSPPDDIAPEVIGAVGNLQQEVLSIRKTVKEIIKYQESLVECTVDADCGCGGDLLPCSDFTETDCGEQLGCTWYTNNPAAPFCGPNDAHIFDECSDLSLDQCNERIDCDPMECIDGTCQ